MRSVHHALALLIATAVPAFAADPIVVEQDRARILQLSQDADNIIIGNPAYFEMTVEDPRTLILFGRTPGQTNMIVLDKEKKEILSASVVVLPGSEASVRVFTPLKGGTGVTETMYSCSGRNCAQTTAGQTSTATVSSAPPADAGGGAGAPGMPGVGSMPSAPTQ